ERAGELRCPRREPEVLEGAVDGLATRWHVVHPGDEVEVLADREVLPEREALRHVAHVALDLVALRANVVAEAGSGSGVGRQEAAHQADRRRLAAAVRSEEAEDLAAVRPQREVDHDMLVAEVLVEAVHVDRGIACRRGGNHCSVTATGWPGLSAAALAAGRASTRKTSLARVSLL